MSKDDYWGFRGSRVIWVALMLIVCPAYTCYGYNQAVAGNVLTLQSFVRAFPSIDTVNAKGATESHNSTIQGIHNRQFCLHVHAE